MEFGKRPAMRLLRSLLGDLSAGLVRSAGLAAVAAVWLAERQGKNDDPAMERVRLATLRAIGLSVGAWAARTDRQQDREELQTDRIDRIAALVDDATKAAAENERLAAARERRLLDQTQRLLRLTVALVVLGTLTLIAATLALRL